jgi:hypothetical protein
MIKLSDVQVGRSIGAGFVPINGARPHRLDHEEVLEPANASPTLTPAASPLRARETASNCDRFSLAVQAHTPAEKLANHFSPPAA